MRDVFVSLSANLGIMYLATSVFAANADVCG